MWKYVVRFGICAAVVVPILAWVNPAEGLKTLLYKLAMSSMAVGLAELVWATGFKPFIRNLEKLHAGEVLIFRGCLYAAIIIGFCVGL